MLICFIIGGNKNRKYKNAALAKEKLDDKNKLHKKSKIKLRYNFKDVTAQQKNGRNDLYFSKYKKSYSPHNVKKKAVKATFAAHDSKFSSVKKIEINGSQQNRNQTKKALKVKENTIPLKYSDLSFLDENASVDINEMGHRSRETNRLDKINGLRKNIGTTVSARYKIIAPPNKQNRFSRIDYGKMRCLLHFILY